jgi:hypothetical protein
VGIGLSPLCAVPVFFMFIYVFFMGSYAMYARPNAFMCPVKE